MKILVIGSGGREHAIVWKLTQSKNVEKVYCAPGNGGISKLAECIDIKVEDIKGLIDFVKNNKIDVTVVGPELPLVLGIVDEFQKNGLKIFGPSKSAAQLEGSKVFSKQLMWKYKIPTADGKIFTDARLAIDYIKSHKVPIVIKADGLAAGKGVIVAKNVEEAVLAVSDIMEKKIFGEAGSKLLVEECLEGEEVSILAFSDGKNVIPLVPSQDHKRIFDNDKGPNTGGMGAYSPVPVMNEELQFKILKEVLEPTVKAMANEGHVYKGILYAGLMLTKNGPKVLEYNVRFGDPETQAVLPRMTSDLLDPIIGIINGDISRCNVSWTKEACICIVIASGGYPDKYEKGFEINGLDSVTEAIVFHAGTKTENDKIVSAGGRVLGVTALGNTVDEAVKKGYSAVSKINFKNMQYRKDIAHRAIIK
jgi:phosphoribosylamine--glycine ligase